MSLDKTLIVVNGLPATGKTTIARQLSERLGLPLFIKDDYKEAIFDRLGYSDREWSKKVGSAAIRIHFLAVEACLRVGQSCIMENFMRRLTEDNFGETITDLCQQYGFRVIQILVKADGQEVYRRFEQRALSGNRHSGHHDAECLDEHKPTLLKGRLEPLDLPGMTIEVDTTDFSVIDTASIARLIQNFLQ